MPILKPPRLESAYVVRGSLSPEAISRSLQALLPTRQRPLARTRYTELDTFDRRVQRAGARLIRAGVNGDVTMAWDERGQSGPLTIRVGQPVSFAWDLPEGPFLEVLAPVVDVRRLLPRVEAEAWGWLLEILDDRGKIVARLRVESARTRAPRARAGWHDLPTVLTLTGLRGYEDAFARFTLVLESRPGLERCPEGLHGLIRSRADEADGLAGTQPQLDLPPTVAAADGARQIHLALLGILTANEPGIRASLDTEFLHDYRVALRRARSLLGQIRHVFPPHVTRHVAAELSWLGRLTGPARDMDVLVLALRTHRGDIPAADMDALTRFISDAQRREYRRLTRAFGTDRYRRLLADWRAFLERPTPPGADAANAHRPLADVIGARAWQLSRRIAERADTAGGHTTTGRLHEVRLDAKKLRYLVDVTPGLFDAADLTRVLNALKRLQRVLGEFNDAQVQERRLLDCGHALGAAGGPPGAVLALGRLAERCRQRHERLREPVAEALECFRTKGTRSASRAFKRTGRPERAG